jgi:hypothetical protein
MKQLRQKKFTGERALFQSENIKIYDSVFFDGESPLKESKGIEIYGSTFKWKYPLWYCRNIIVEDSFLLETARSGIWYTENINIKNSTIAAPKTFRKSSGIILNSVDLPFAQETFWNCVDIQLTNVTAKGDYFGMQSENIKAKNINITGNYAFDSVRNIEIYDSKLLSKDAFWNCENVTVRNSTIIGEYLGWNSKNLTFIDCRIESLQGLCYIENLTLINCKLINTTQAFEYSTVTVESITHIDSVMNPTSGIIKAPSIGEVVLDDVKVDANKTTIINND